MTRAYPLHLPASTAYAAWVAHTSLRSRPWDMLTPEEQAAWVAVAAAVLEWAEGRGP